MKKFIKQYCFISLLACIFFACSPTEELINNVDSGTTSVMPQMRRLAGNAGISNAFSFDSIAEADAMLEAMQSVEDAESFYNTYISNSNVNNKYLNSIYEYMCIVESIEAGDSINALLALTENQDSLFNVYVDGGDTIVEPLSCFDYRCLVNEDNVFVVGDRAYHLFDTIFITCPITYHANLVEISQDSTRLAILIEDLKAERIEIPDTTMIQTRERNPDDGIADLDYVYACARTSTFHTLKYLRTENKHRMKVTISAHKRYVKYLNRTDLIAEHVARTYQKCLGIWWLSTEKLNLDIKYVAKFVRGWTIYPVEFDDAYTASSLAPAKKTIECHPWSNLVFCHYGLEGISFIISSKHMTITSDNENLVEIVE